jgi:hypothetical protein
MLTSIPPLPQAAQKVMKNIFSRYPSFLLDPVPTKYQSAVLSFLALYSIFGVSFPALKVYSKSNIAPIL